MRAISRGLMLFSAFCLLAGGIAHSMACAKAASIAAQAHLRVPYAAMFEGLWINASTTSFAMAIVFTFVAAFPSVAARPLVILLALLPFASAGAIYATMGNFLPGHVLLAAGIAALAAGIFHFDGPGKTSALSAALG